jgi:hypothetical protein
LYYVIDFVATKSKSPKTFLTYLCYSTIVIGLFNLTGPTGMEAFYWCPNPNSVDRLKGNLFAGGYSSIGQCYDYLKPPGKISCT